MDDQHLQALLSEYQANLALWQHDDNLRQQRSTTFLSINSLLILTLGGLITLSDSFVEAAVVAIPISVFGLPICLLWYQVQIRNAEYIRFRRHQLRAIEKILPPMSTFTNQWRALNNFETVQFENIGAEFTIKNAARGSSTVIEGKLPLVIAGIWLAVFVISIVIIL